ncbi:MAG: hypothetical protein MJK14_12715 [Rivularia sp. ALOHA_DT_140]|nr:hypothetical protein [Rivularia sp. ALOHA_DT_140]
MLASAPTERFQSATEVIAKLQNNKNYNPNINPTVTDNNLKPRMSLGGIISSILPRRTINQEQQNVNNQNSFEQIGQTPVSQNPEFIDYCRSQLTSFVGPLASMVMEQTLSEKPDMISKEFVEVLANKIPDEKRAESFISHIKLLKE